MTDQSYWTLLVLPFIILQVSGRNTRALRSSNSESVFVAVKVVPEDAAVLAGRAPSETTYEW